MSVSASRFKVGPAVRRTRLDLSIARSVTDRYGGEIRVENRVPGDHTKGACFIVVFPKA